jgi:hypothetical protein
MDFFFFFFLKEQPSIAQEKNKVESLQRAIISINYEKYVVNLNRK